MAYYAAAEVRRFAPDTSEDAAVFDIGKSQKSTYGDYDVFLSHSARDAHVILSVMRIPESQGLWVYVDCVDEKDLGRDSISAAADSLRWKMKKSKSLVYAISRNASRSW